MNHCSGIILAGGQSRRMGQDKALMTLGGRALIQRVLDALAPLCAEIILVTNAPERYAHLPVRLTHDLFPDTGSLGGLYSGLTAAAHEVAVAVACDMPFLSTPLLGYLQACTQGADVVVPDLSETKIQAKLADEGDHKKKAKQLDLHPLHAIYRRTCLAPIEAQLQTGDLRMMGFFAQVRTRYVSRAEVLGFDPQLRSFFNVNTPEEWAEAERWVTGGGGSRQGGEGQRIG